MHGEQEPGPRPDGTREWLLQLERRVTALEHAAEIALRKRRRGRLLFLLGVALYLLVLYWEMTRLDF